jgi:serine/threonine protein phosphatase 1
MWIRKGWLDARPMAMRGAPLVVHGHTVVDAPEHHGHRVNLDAGAGYGEPLVAAAVDGREVWLLSEHGRTRLEPPGDHG